MPLIPEDDATAMVMAGIPATNKSLFHAMRFNVGDPAAVIVTRQGDAVERFEQRFRRPATLASFIETFTCVEVQDFVAKYRDGPDTA